MRISDWSSDVCSSDLTQDRLRNGDLDLLYVAPERASGEAFRTLLRAAKIALFAIDEAHCVSEWGHDFRPDYRLLRPLLDEFPDVPRRSEEHTSELQSLMRISYAVFCLQKNNIKFTSTT